MKTPDYKTYVIIDKKGTNNQKVRWEVFHKNSLIASGTVYDEATAKREAWKAQKKHMEVE